jgi:anaerobic magnesium-protoporphyrin IX monomethyl ester cyclase
VARILLLNPSRWGRGITTIWVASHSATLKSQGHEVELFDTTFFKDWAQNENAFNTSNLQYKPSPYESMIEWDSSSVRVAFQQKIDIFSPEVIFWSALSSHIHGEGEYAAIQFGHELVQQVKTSATKVCGGLQPTAAPIETASRFQAVDYFIAGESEFVLADLVDRLREGRSPAGMPGVIAREKTGVIVGAKQALISDLDQIGLYDYSLFNDQSLLRPYNGEVVRAVDYELSRGCPYTCAYCVETVIQSYYGFIEITPRGALRGANRYLRHKSASRVFAEISMLYEERGVTLFRCQDTNFLTIDRGMLKDLAEKFESTKIPVKLYIETRPEGINRGTIGLLQRLNVDGVGMGIELATQDFRESKLNRFSDQAAIINAFELLRDAGIKRTTYNIIGIPDQTESSVLETIEFNRTLNPDNVTVAFYSPYLGTEQQRQGAEKDYFLDYEFDLDSQLRTMTHHSVLSATTLAFYKKNFVRLVREGLDILPKLKSESFLT